MDKLNIVDRLFEAMFTTMMIVLGTCMCILMVVVTYNVVVAVLS